MKKIKHFLLILKITNQSSNKMRETEFDEDQFYSDSEVSPKISRWQRLYPTDGKDVDKYEEYMNPLLKNNDDDLQAWAENIRSSEDAMARLRVTLGQHYQEGGDIFVATAGQSENMSKLSQSIVPETYIFGDIGDASFDIQVDDLGLCSRDSLLSTEFEFQKYLNSSVDNSYDTDEGLMLKALNHHQARARAICFQRWHDFIVDELLRRERLTDWFEMNASRQRCKQFFVAWACHSKLRRSILEVFKLKRYLRLTQNVFDAWFHFVKEELYKIEVSSRRKILSIQMKHFYFSMVKVCLHDL